MHLFFINKTVASQEAGIRPWAIDRAGLRMVQRKIFLRLEAKWLMVDV